MKSLNQLTKKPSFLTGIDLFGKPLMFEEHKAQEFKTLQGAAFSFILFFLVIAAAIIFGQELYERKTPSILRAEEFTDTKNVAVKIKNLPIIFSVVDKYIKTYPYDINSLFNIFLSFYTYDENFNIVFTDYYGFTECIPESFPEHKEYVANIVNNYSANGWNAYCINVPVMEDFEIYNSYGNYNSGGIRIAMNDCSRELRENHEIAFLNPERVAAAPECEEKRHEILGNAFLIVNTMNSFFNYKNYKDPLVTSAQSIPFNISYGLMSDVYLSFGTEFLKSDKGWMLENYEEVSTHFIQNTSFRANSPSVKNEVLSFQIDFPIKIVSTTRIYLKIQELFAKIGGLFNGIFLVMKLIMFDFVNYKFKTQYSQYTIESDLQLDNMTLNNSLYKSNIKRINNMSGVQSIINKYDSNKVNPNMKYKEAQKDSNNQEKGEFTQPGNVMSTLKKENFNDTKSKLIKYNNFTNNYNNNNIGINDLNKKNIVSNNNGPAHSNNNIPNLVKAETNNNNENQNRNLDIKDNTGSDDNKNNIHNDNRNNNLNNNNDQAYNFMKNINSTTVFAKKERFSDKVQSLNYFIYLKDKIIYYIFCCIFKRKTKFSMIIDDENFISVFKFSNYLNTLVKFNYIEEKIIHSGEYD